jgi:arsenate reductase (glutaredoxin)
MGENVVIYHNPRCSKSRAALSLLKEQGESVREIRYLETPISPCELAALAKGMGLEPLQFMRTGEKVFTELGLTREDSRPREEWFQIMADHPILIERPIVVKGDKVRLGRPVDRILEIL